MNTLIAKKKIVYADILKLLQNTLHFGKLSSKERKRGLYLAPKGKE
jgi:hypothetical protein